MKKIPESSDKFEQLGQRLRELLRRRPDAPDAPPSDILGILHELQIHQANLERRNEELRRMNRDAARLHRRHTEMQKTLRKSEERYRQLFESLQEGVWVIDKHAKTSFVNPSMAALLGYTPGEMAGMHLFEFMDREGIEIAKTKIEQRRKGTKEQHEFKFHHKDGTPVYTLIETTPLFDDEGRYSGALASVMDISDRKRAEEILESKNRLMSTLLENLEMGVFMVEAPTGKPLLANRRAKELLGRGIMDEADKTTLAEVYQAYKRGTDELYPQDRMPIVRGLYGEHRSVDDMIVVHPDGSRFHLEVSGCPVRDGQGNVVASLVCFADITTRKRHEAEILKLNETLEQRVAGRTAELENRTRQLQQLALEMSSTEDRERHRIASLLHDDFQQQLAYIKMDLGLMAKDSIDGKVAQRLGFLERLIGESIEKSRNLSYELNPPALHRNGLLTAIDTLSREMKEKHGLRVDVHTAPDAEPDSPTLASILYRAARELLFNVAKHAGTDSAVLDIRGINGKIRIQVEDAGRGFDYGTVRSRQGRGVGFGLYNIEDRVTFLGGDMRVETTPGRGCRVVLTVPKDVSRQTGGPGPPHEDRVGRERIPLEPGAPPPPAGCGGQIRILLADDHRLMREALARLLQSCNGLTIAGQAVNGREAIRLAAELSPHVILMDVTMPELDGVEATAHISRAHPHIRIIGLSMHNDTDTRRKMLDAGADAYLTKTGSPDTLVQTIRRLASRQ